MEEKRTLKQHRQLKGWSIETLAQRAGSSSATIVKIEKGIPARPSSYFRLAAALEIEATDIREFLESVLRDSQ